MNVNSTTKYLGLALCAGLATASPALADVKDFEFQLVQSEVKQGEGAIVAVTLLNKHTKHPVPDAVIFARRIDMAPDGMPTMTADLEPLPPKEPGIYTFRTTLTMAGTWQLSLAAKVQGVGGTLQSKLMLKARE